MQDTTEPTSIVTTNLSKRQIDVLVMEHIFLMPTKWAPSLQDYVYHDAPAGATESVESFPAVPVPKFSSHIGIAYRIIKQLQKVLGLEFSLEMHVNSEGIIQWHASFCASHFECGTADSNNVAKCIALAAVRFVTQSHITNTKNAEGITNNLYRDPTANVCIPE